ncbi:MAG: hypothetical protein KJ606_07380 [Chloroflexi bacterium]|nr:hypothetical protein [Chloroflexota bacterium]
MSLLPSRPSAVDSRIISSFLLKAYSEKLVSDNNLFPILVNASNAITLFVIRHILLC